MFAGPDWNDMATASSDRRRGLTGDKGIKAPVKLATTANITLSGEQSIDGVTTSSNRVLVKDQTDTSANGIYDTGTGAWTRALDFNGNSDIARGTMVRVTHGTVNAGTMYSVSSDAPTSIGSSAITFETAVAVADIATQLANTSSTSYGDALVGVKRTDTGATATTLHAWIERQALNVKDFGAVGDGSTNDAASIQAAIDAASTAGGGTVLFPRGTYKITTALAMKDKVDLVGFGGRSSIIAPNGCDGLTYGYTSSFGNSRISNIGIEGTSTTAKIGIYQAGTLNDADELYGITIDNCLIRGFNVSIKFRTVRDVTIANNWLQDTNGGIHLVGKCLVVNIHDNKIVFAAGSGTGTQYGVYCDWFNYTSGSGNVRPESVKIRDNTIYGFDYGIAFEASIFGLAEGNDINADIEGVVWEDASNLLVIRDNYIQIAGAAGSVAVRGKDQSAVIDTKVVIEANHINGVNNTAGTSIGVQVGTSAVGNCDNVRIVGNSFYGFTLYDIIVNKSGHVLIEDNACYSTGATESIVTSTLPTGRPVYIRNNDCYDTIGYDSSDFNSGDLRLGVNVVSGTTVSDGAVSTVASAASIDLPLGSAVFSITGTTNITSVGVTGWTGKRATLVFAGILTFTDGSNLKLAGNFVTSADDSITLVCDGTNWYEVARSAN